MFFSPPTFLLLPNPCKTSAFRLVYHLLCSAFPAHVTLPSFLILTGLFAVHMHSSLPILSCQPHNLSPLRLHYPVIQSLVQFPIFPLVAQIIYYKMGHVRYGLFPYFVQPPVMWHHTWSWIHTFHSYFLMCGLAGFAHETYIFNRLTPNDPYMGRTAPLTSKRCILYIYSTNIGTEYFNHALYSPSFFSSKCNLFHNANLFGFCIIHILYTGCANIKKIIPAPKG